MTDIVERLRSMLACDLGCEGRCYDCPSTVAKEAADQIEWLRSVLRCIALPGKQITYCQDGHEAAVLIARDALERGMPAPAVDNLSCGGSGSCCQGLCRARW